MELFAGGGGMALGAEAAGWAHVALVERWDRAAATLRWNRPAWRVIRADLDVINWTSQGIGRVDLLCGGPPCQPYSEAGWGAGESDERDGWPATLVAVEALHPRWVCFENVTGMLGTPELDRVRAVLRSRYTWVDTWVVSAADHGVAQDRARVFVVGGPAKRQPPRGTHVSLDRVHWLERRPPWVSVRQALGFPLHATGIRRGHGFLPDRIANLDRPSLTLTTASFGVGSDLRVNLSPGLTEREQATLDATPRDLYGRLMDRPPDGWKWEGRHGPDGMRRLTEEEVHVLAGFPPGWRFDGPQSARMKQRGNSCPPALAAAVLRQLGD